MANSSLDSENSLIQVVQLLFDNIWPLIIILILFLFRSPITDLIKRATSIKYKKGESSFSIDTNDTQSPNTETPPIKQQEQKKEKVVSDTEQIKISKDPLSWFPNLHKAVLAKDFEEAQRIFFEYSANESDETALLKHKSMYYYVLFADGNDSQALEKLEDMYTKSTTPSVKLDAAEWLDLCYKQASLNKKALAMWQEMFETVTDEEYRTDITIRLAGSLNVESNPQKGKELLLARLRNESKPYKIGNLYKALSDIESELGNETLAVYCLDKTLEFRANNDDTFDSAYRASECDIEDISISNYLNLVKVNSENWTAYNNLGVKAQELEIPSIAISYYKKATDSKSSLGLTNYGYLLLEAGFIDEAMEAAQKALAIEDPHENAHALITAINKKKTVEAEKWKELVNIASKRQKLKRQYTEQYYLGDSKLLEGDWTVKNDRVTINIENNKIDVVWDESVFLLKDVKCSRRLIAEVHGSTLIGRVYTSYDKHSQISLLTPTDKDNPIKCFGLLVNNNDEILLFSTEFPETLQVSFKRK